MKKILLPILVLCLLLSLCGCVSSAKEYKAALALMDAGEYSRAEEAFTGLGDYKDAPSKAKDCRYQIALAFMDSGDYASACNEFESLGEYGDAAGKYSECRYLQAGECFAAGDIPEAADIYSSLGEYKDSVEKYALCLNEQQYVLAVEQLQIGKDSCAAEPLTAARAAFQELGSYKDSAALFKESCFLLAKNTLNKEAVTIADCLTAREFFSESADYSEETEASTSSLNRKLLWLYIRENGTEEADAEGVTCRKLSFESNGTADTGHSSEIITVNKPIAYAYEDETLALTCEQTYTSGGTSYTESLSVTFGTDISRNVDVLVSAYTDYGIYSSYISENYRGIADAAALKTKEDVATKSYVQQARKVSGKNTQSLEYTDQISIERILNTLPDFFAEWDNVFTGLPFTFSVAGMGFGTAESGPVHAYETTGLEPGSASDSYVPAEKELFAKERKVLVISLTGAEVRKGPSNTYRLIETLPFNDTSVSSALRDGWLYIRYNEQEYGWVDIHQLFGEWMFEENINPALTGIRAPKNYADELTVIATTDKANARSSPERDGTMLSSYITGTLGVCVGTVKNWYLMNFDGEYGWMHENNFK